MSDIESIKARLEKATKGEWSAVRVPTSIGHAWKIMPFKACLYVDGQRIPHDLKNASSLEAEANADLIVHAKSDIAFLLAEVERKDRALKLVDQVWTRSQLHPDVNFMGDDEHEAWKSVKEAIQPPTDPRKS